MAGSVGLQAGRKGYPARDISNEVRKSPRELWDLVSQEKPFAVIFPLGTLDESYRNGRSEEVD